MLGPSRGGLGHVVEYSVTWSEGDVAALLHSQVGSGAPASSPDTQDAHVPPAAAAEQQFSPRTGIELGASLLESRATLGACRLPQGRSFRVYLRLLGI